MANDAVGQSGMTVYSADGVHDEPVSNVTVVMEPQTGEYAWIEDGKLVPNKSKWLSDRDNASNDYDPNSFIESTLVDVPSPNSSNGHKPDLSTGQAVFDYIADRVGGTPGAKTGLGHCPHPEHIDNNPSFVWRIEDGNVRIKCFAGCEYDELLEALSLERGDLYPNGDRVKHGSKEVVATYDYYDPDRDTIEYHFENLSYQKIRYADKSFAVRSTEDGGATWQWKMEGHKHLLYYPDVVRTDSNTVFFVEGEKDVDKLNAMGLRAVSLDFGAESQWQTYYTEQFNELDVVVIPDNDSPGKKYAQRIIDALKGVANSVRYLELDGLDEHGDVSDWLEQGHTRAELEALAITPNTKPTTIETHNGTVYSASSVLKASQEKTKEIDWLLYPYFPKGKVVGAEGESELGKSLVFVDIMAKITTGKPLPNGEHTEPSSVIYISFEDDPQDTIIPRLIKAGADLDKVFIIYMVGYGNDTAKRFFDIGIPSDVDLLRDTITQTGAVLVVIDPITQALGGKTNSYNEAEVRKALAPLMQMSQETGACILNVRHHKKGKSDNMKEQGIGSGGFFNIPRSVIGFYVDPQDETEETRLFVHKKCNLASHAKPYKYKVVGSRTVTPSVQWLGESNLTNRQILEGERRTGQLNKDIVDLLKVAPDGCMKTSLIKDVMVYQKGYTESNVHSTLNRMVGKELKENTPRGTHCLAA
jgi:hypothetical protein